MNRDSTSDSRTPPTVEVASSGPSSGWSTPQPERVPAPTVAPAALALGATLAAFGALTSPIISIVGGAVAGGAVVAWIRGNHDEHTR